MSESTKPPGKKPRRLKIESDDWKKAVEKAVKQKRPKKGWPKPEPGPT